MNLLSNLSKIVSGKKKRVGRGAGSGVGAKSGRGTTRHQGARTTIPLHFEGGQGKMVKRFPKLRGKGRNKSIHEKPFIISLEMLEQFESGATVTPKALLEQKIITKSEAEKRTFKVVSNGKLTKKLTIALPVSQSAKSLIEKAGGTVQ